MDNYPYSVNEPPPLNTGSAGFQPTGPRPFGEIPSLWLKVLKMDEAFFAAERLRASAGNTLLSVIIAGVVVMIISALSTYLGSFSWIMNMSGAKGLGGMRDFSVGALLYLVCFGLIGYPIGYYLSNGLYYIGARLLGGQGGFTEQAYLFSLFSVPLGILSSLVSLIPCLGALLALGISIFSLILGYRMMKVTHNLTEGKAWISVLWPVLLVLFVGCCIGVGLVVAGVGMGDFLRNLPRQ